MDNTWTWRNAYGWLLLYGNALVLVGFHIDLHLYY
jgi:hypothetical protein